MNAFYEHHKDSIRFAYRCFDRYAVPQLGQEPLPEMGCTDSGRSPRPAR